MKKKVLVFGGSGLVGSRFIELNENQFDINAPLAEETNILDETDIKNVFEKFSPDAVINFAAFTNVEEAQKQKDDKEGMVFKINAMGARNVAKFCKEYRAHLVHISTEYVFDGTKESGPYQEDDQPNPINWYGQTKYYGEQFVRESGCMLTLVRISMPFSSGYGAKKDIARFFLEELSNNHEIKAIENQRITPTLVDDIAKGLALVVDRKPQGIYHLCSISFTTPFELAKLLANDFGLDKSLIKPISLTMYNQTKTAKLLKNSWLSPNKFIKEYGKILHSVEEAVSLFKQMIDEMSPH